MNIVSTHVGEENWLAAEGAHCDNIENIDKSDATGNDR